jgi:hypothetical protein
LYKYAPHTSEPYISIGLIIVSNILIYASTDRFGKNLYFVLNENSALDALSYRYLIVALNLPDGVRIKPK